MRRSGKYNAKRTTVEGITFHSAKEARRYQELRLLEKAGEIVDLGRQPSFLLHALGATMRDQNIGTYLADFQYFDENSKAWVYEDVKGYDTPLSKWKRKHVKAQYGIDVVLV